MPPPLSEQHDGSVFAGCVGPLSHEMAQAPVSVPSNGSKQGTQSFLQAVLAFSSRDSFAYTLKVQMIRKQLLKIRKYSFRFSKKVMC